jgi:uncharacterized delta-60 repeat protein
VEALEDRCVPGAAGALDPTFGNGAGYVTASTSSFNDRAHAVLIQPDSKIVAAGRAQISATGYDAALARFNPDGTLDTSFGSGGLAATTFGTSSIAWGEAIYPNAGTANDGKIVITGNSTDSAGKTNVLVARYLGNAVASPSFSVTGFPSSTTAGVAGAITVTADEASGNLNPNYTGTVHFTSGDAKAVLPADYTFTADDAGVHTFTSAFVLRERGTDTLTATDLVSSALTATDSISVS